MGRAKYSRFHSPEKGFCEAYDKDGNVAALIVHSAWKGKRRIKWLRRGQFDSYEQMWDEGREVMKQFLEEQGKPDTDAKIQWRSVVGGITYRKSQDAWTAFWAEPDGKLGTASFSVKKYGPRKAKKLARQTRDQMVRYRYGFDPRKFREKRR